VLSKVPGTDGLISEARSLQEDSDRQMQYNQSRAMEMPRFDAPPGTQGGPPGPGIPGMSLDPQAAVAKIYPILVFR
jgi:hypothetical protein